MFRPNIVYLHSHDTGRYIQPYGYAVPTPRLQKLAEEGVLFRQAFSAAPTCSPSRAALLTGMMPHNNGMLGLAHFGFQLNDYSQHLLHTLRKAGYTSVLTGMQHVAGGARPGKMTGYDIVPNEEDGRARRGSEEWAVDFLRSTPPQPFFLDAGFQETHRPFAEPEPQDNPNYLRPPVPIPDTPETRLDMAGFLHSARELDRKMGQVLDALEETGLAENTLVICTTDHGLAFPNMKCSLTDHGTGVMLIVRGPGGFSGGRVFDALVSQIDLFPTLCELLEIEPPEWLQGQSLMPLVRGETDSIRPAVFSEINFHVAYDPQRAVRTHRWKYIARFDGRSRPVLPNVDDGPTKSLWLENGWRDRSIDQEQLYDLLFDPNEMNNLVNDPACAAVLGELRSQLHAWMHATGDPLLQGPLVWPEGFPHLDPDQISPSEIEWKKSV